MIADGPGSPLDQGVATWLMVAAVFLGWIGIARLRGRAFARVPRPWAWTLVGLAVASLILAVALPPIIRPNPPAQRPTSTATVSIVTPSDGQVFQGNPAQAGTVSVPVVVRLQGGHIVPFSSTKLTDDTGHIHVYVDGIIATMSAGLHTTIPVTPGHHTLTAEFVAVDHIPFDPRVRATVRFDVQP
jgi:hypothetical protein